MGVLQRLKRAITTGETATESYSIAICRCGECGAVFESKTAPEHAHCPDCESTDVRPIE